MQSTPYLNLSMDGDSEAQSDAAAAVNDEAGDMNHALIDQSPHERKRLASVGFEGLNQATIFSSIANLANTIMGSGILGLPNAFAACGSILGSVMLVVAGIASGMALHLLSLAAKRTGLPSSFYTVAKATVPKWTFLIDLAVAIKCFGVATSYLIVCGDLMPVAIRQMNEDAPSVWRNREMWVFLGFAIIVPFSCLKRLDALKFTSAVSVAFVYFLVIVVLAYAIGGNGFDPCESLDDDETCKGSTSVFTLNLNTMHTLPIFIFGYTCHQNIFTVCNELKNPTVKRVDTVIASSIGMAFVLYMIVANSGYATYGDKVSSDILESYPENTLVTVVRIFVSYLVIFSYPLQCHPARMCVMALWKAATGGQEPSIAQANFRYATITVVFLGLSLVIALSLDDLGVMLSLVGATGSTMVSYILPGLMYYVLFKDDQPDHWQTKFAYGLFVAGIIIMPVCLVLVFV